jgi:hypothetical protein
MALKIDGTNSKLIFLAGTANTTTLTSSLTATPWTMTLPPTAGTAGQVLTTDGSGVLSWSTGGGGGGLPAAPVNSVQFNNGGAFGGSSNLTWINGSNFLGIGTATPAHELEVIGDAYAEHCASTQGMDLNLNSIPQSYTLPTNYNSVSGGPILTPAGVTVTVNAGSRWTVV